MEELEKVKIQNATMKDDTRDAQVRHQAELDESTAGRKRMHIVLTECQQEVGRLEAAMKTTTTHKHDTDEQMVALSAQVEECESERLSAVAELRTLFFMVHC